MTITHNILLSSVASLVLLAGMERAEAADLGGDCCADLEERVAELEATTARKGNRKVSLTISGWVARELYVWDDGDLSDAYIVDPSTTLATHFKFSGEGQIKPGWKAGFVLHIETPNPGSIFVDQFNDEGSATGAENEQLNTLEAKWFIESERLGRISLGRLSQASDNTAILADFSGTLVQSNWVLFDGASFFLRPESSGFVGRAGLETADGFNGNRWGTALGFCGTTGLGIGADCNGLPRDAVRYDSPSFGGAVVSASWGENDFWDVAINYQAEWNSIKFKAAAAYNWWGDNKVPGELLDPLARFNQEADGSYLQIGAMVMHTPSGLFLYGAYGTEDVDDRFINVNAAYDFQEVDDGDHWFVKAGIRKTWLSYGPTVFYGAYAQYNDMYGGFDCDFTLATTAIGQGCATPGGITITGSELSRWDFGVVQEFDSAALQVYAKWLRLEGEIDFEVNGYYEANDGPYKKGFRGSQDYEALDQVLLGALINF